MNQLIEVNGIHLNIVQHGREQQRPLVLLHGFTGSAASWEPLVPDLVACGMHVIALDMLGHGGSDAPADLQRYSIEHCAADIVVALQTLGIARGEAILLGYSMGGRIALYTAFSGFFHALVLESASPGLAGQTEREQRRLSDGALAARIERDGVAPFVTYWEKLPLFASQSALPLALQEAQRRQRLNNHAIGLANSLRGIGTGVQPSLASQLPTLDIPVLLLAGALDPKFCSIAQHMQQAIPDARLHIVPDAGHAIHLEQLGTFTRLVAKFCQSVVH